jgi:hypothetical protein
MLLDTGKRQVIAKNDKFGNKGVTNPSLKKIAPNQFNQTD